MTVRSALYLYSPRAGHELTDISDWIQHTPLGGDDYLRINGIGEILAWSSFDSGNFFQPRPELADTAKKEMLPVVRFLVEHRCPFRIHATHDESISPRNIERVAALNGGISVQDRLAFQGEYFVDRHGPAKAREAQPVKRTMEMGIPVGAGTDGTRLASYYPWVSLRWMITGKTVGGTQVLGDGGRLNRTEALRRYTEGGAWFLRGGGQEGCAGARQARRFGGPVRGLLHRAGERNRTPGIRPDRHRRPHRERLRTVQAARSASGPGESDVVAGRRRSVPAEVGQCRARRHQARDVRLHRPLTHRRTR
jgi:predicted amidohydrolase YtcJ